MELKFRAWDDKRFTYSGEYHSQALHNENLSEFFNECHGCDIQQYTGMNDGIYDGQEIYDGDIIENCDTGSLQVVYWNRNEAAWYCRYLDDEKRIVSLADSIGNLNKVVGNVYENPALMTDRHDR